MDWMTAFRWIQFWALSITFKGLAVVKTEICIEPVCYFEMDVTILKTMTYRDLYGGLNPVFFNGTKLQANVRGQVKTLSPHDVIVADGFEREVTVFNGQLPGPTIEVMEGAQIVVKVSNSMAQKKVTVHWHGILQHNTYFMDGVDGITQCPILPGQSFTYRFWARPVGTHWYHAHVMTMRLDGLFGMLIIHASIPQIPYFAISVNDWYHDVSKQRMARHDVCIGKPLIRKFKIQTNITAECTFEGAGLNLELYASTLFGGLGRLRNQPIPLKVYGVKAGERYRFRMVNAGKKFPYLIRIDDHQLTIVASDGAEIEPIIVDSFFIVTAESIDFEINADQTPGRYWIRAETQCDGAFGQGILAYEGFEDDIEDPFSQPRDCTPEAPCRVFNCPFGRYPDGINRICITMSHARSTLSANELARQYGIGDEDVIEIIMNYANFPGPSVNGRLFSLPMVPLFHDASTDSDCVGEPCLDGCSCRCTDIKTLPYGRTVRLVVTNLQLVPYDLLDMYHTFHMHGHRFAVLAEKFPTYNSSTGKVISPNMDVTCGSDNLCTNPQWSGSRPRFRHVRHPVIKDSIVIPFRGYVVLQFKTYNPGFWMLHCHIDMHMMSGMTTVFKVAPNRFPDLPPDFPICNNASSHHGQHHR